MVQFTSQGVITLGDTESPAGLSVIAPNMEQSLQKVQLVQLEEHRIRGNSDMTSVMLL